MREAFWCFARTLFSLRDQHRAAGTDIPWRQSIHGLAPAQVSSTPRPPSISQIREIIVSSSSQNRPCGLPYFLQHARKCGFTLATVAKFSVSADILRRTFQFSWFPGWGLVVAVSFRVEESLGASVWAVDRGEVSSASSGRCLFRGFFGGRA